MQFPSILISRTINSLLQQYGLTILCKWKAITVVCIQVLPHWTVASSLWEHKKSNWSNKYLSKQTDILCYGCIQESWVGQGQESTKTTSALYQILDGLINPKFQHYWGFFISCPPWSQSGPGALPRPFPAWSVANRLYQWKQHWFVQDDTFSE